MSQNADSARCQIFCCFVFPHGSHASCGAVADRCFRINEMADKCPAVDWARPVFPQCRNMSSTAIAFILRKSIFRIQPVVLLHDAVPGNLCKNTGRSYRQTFFISLDHRHLRQMQPRYAHRVHDQYLRLRPELLLSPPHCLIGCL